MKIPSNILTLVVGVIVTLISLWYGQNHGLMPVEASQEAAEVDNLFNLMVTIATGLFLIVEGTLVICLIRFRRKKNDTTDGPAIEGNVPLEILWTAIPTIIVFILAVYSFEIYNNMGGLDPMASHGMSPQQMANHQNSGQLVAFNPNEKLALGIGRSPNEQSEQPSLVVDVNGIQYAWIFNYSDTGIVSGELHVPVNRPVQLNLKAGDVIHAFWLPEFRIKQDAIPGRDTQLSFNPSRTGQYPIICAELCGAYHGGMKSVLYVHTEEEYNQWVQDNTFAQADQLTEAVAVNPATLKPGEFLTPYAKEIGISQETLQQLHHNH